VKLSRLWRKKRSLHYYVPWSGTWEEALKKNAAETKISFGSEAIAEGDRKRRADFLKNFPAGETHIEGQGQQLLAALAVVLSEHQVTSLKVLDFGGSWGMFYHYLQRALPGITLDWLIIETEATVKTFASCAENHLRWQATLPDVPEGSIRSRDKTFDLCLASAVLHHVDFPETMVQRLAKLGRYVLINRIPVLDREEDQMVFQRCSNSSDQDLNLPAWLFSEKKLVRLLQSLGKLRLDWTVPQDKATLEGKSVSFRGYLLQAGPRD
jgi:putative methyltransferase (TIGR04325 family)